MGDGLEPVDVEARETGEVVEAADVGGADVVTRGQGLPERRAGLGAEVPSDDGADLGVQGVAGGGDGVGGGRSALVLVSLVTRPPSAATIARYFPPARAAARVAAP